MKVWKFWVPRGVWTTVVVEAEGELEVQGCLAIVVAQDEARARAILVAYGEVTGIDTRWVKAARVASFDVTIPAVVGYAEV